MKKTVFFLMIIVLLSLPAVWSLFHSGFFPSHDGEWMVIRLSDFHRSFVSGQIPVRWADRLNHSYGYPVFNFLYPLSLYLGEFFHLGGFDFVTAVKLVFVATFILSGWLMFLWIKGKWGDLAGLTSALVYLYTPYRLVDVYVRGSLGEALAFVFPPLLFWGLERLTHVFDRRFFVLAALALAGLITSHNTLALLFVLLLGFYWLDQGRPKSFIFLILLGLGLSAFFWLPAIWDKQFVIFEKAEVSNFFHHFPTFKQLLIPSWGYGPSLPLSGEDTISFQVGLLNLLVALVSLLWFQDNFFVWSFWLVFFLMTPLSSWLWRLLLFYNFIQFPWRLLALTTFLSSILAGFLVTRFSRRAQLSLFVLSTGFLLFSTRTYARPEYFVNRPLEFYTTNEGTTTVAAEYTPQWVKVLPEKRPEKKVEIISGRGKIGPLNWNSKRLSFQAKLMEPSRVRINTHYFPGWQLFLNEQREPIDYQENGLVEFDLPAGEASVEIVFSETPLRFIADLISLFSLLIAIVIIKSS